MQASENNKGGQVLSHATPKTLSTMFSQPKSDSESQKQALRRKAWFHPKLVSVHAKFAMPKLSKFGMPMWKWHQGFMHFSASHIANSYDLYSWSLALSLFLPYIWYVLRSIAITIVSVSMRNTYSPGCFENNPQSICFPGAVSR